MDEAGFVIEFQEHLTDETSAHCLNQLADTGACIKSVSDHTYSVTCAKPRQLAHVGWLLFHTHIARKCTVVSVSGSAELRSSAYPHPKA